MELLYTSLLIRVTHAMVHQGARRTARGGSRTRSFRQSFLTAFATRIGERLDGITESGIREGAATDARLLPVLAGRHQAVQQLAEQLFPDMTHDVRSLPRSDGEGWTLGTHTANLAALTAIPSIADDGDTATTDSTPQAENIQDPLFPIPHHF